MYIDYDYDYSLYNYEENECRRTQRREILDIGGAPCARNPIVSRLTCVLFCLARKFEREGDGNGEMKESLDKHDRPRVNARTREGSWWLASERKEKRGDDCARVRGRVNAVLERNTLVYVFLVNSNSSIADFKSIYRYNDNINIIIVIIYDC